MKHVIIAATTPGSLLRAITFVADCSNKLWIKDYEEFINGEEEKKLREDEKKRIFTSLSWKYRFEAKYGIDHDFATTVDNAYFGDGAHFQKMKVHNNLSKNELGEDFAKIGWRIYFGD